MEEDVHLRRIRSVETFGSPACVLLPGSRNTADDLRFLRETRLDTALQAYARTCLTEQKGMLVGICGGFQMLGRFFEDPTALESTKAIAPLNLLPLKTTLCRGKILAQKQATTCPSFTKERIPLSGYEIHHGQSVPVEEGCVPILEDADHRILGYGRTDSSGTIRIWGTYLHGIFDSDIFRNRLCNQLRRDCSHGERGPTMYARNTEIDRLADIFEEAVPLHTLMDFLKISINI